MVTPKHVEELAKCIGMFADTPREKIDRMGERSRDLIIRYQPDRAAAVCVKAVEIATR